MMNEDNMQNIQRTNRSDLLLALKCSTMQIMLAIERNITWGEDGGDVRGGEDEGVMRMGGNGEGERME
jgi:hypothetical protein